MKESKTSKGNEKFKRLIKTFRKDPKDFFHKWRLGIENITPLQQVRGQLIGIIPIFVGLIIGIIVTIRAKTTWLILVLTGSLVISFFQTLGFLQKYIRLIAQDKLMKMISNGGKK